MAAPTAIAATRRSGQGMVKARSGGVEAWSILQGSRSILFGFPNMGWRMSEGCLSMEEHPTIWVSCLEILCIHVYNCVYICRVVPDTQTGWSCFFGVLVCVPLRQRGYNAQKAESDMVYTFEHRPKIEVEHGLRSNST